MEDRDVTTIWQETRHSIHGVVRLARFDPHALGHFNLTLDGYWRSFFPAVLLLPLYLIFWFGIHTPGAPTVSFGRRLLVEGINYPLSWTLWPLVAFYIARAAGWGERYLTYIIAYNWAQIFTQGILLAAGVLLIPAIDAVGWLNLWLTMLLFALAFEAYIARRALGIGWLQAVGLEVLVFVLGQFEGALKNLVMAAGQSAS
jgi:hypothetical protein